MTFSDQTFFQYCLLTIYLIALGMFVAVCFVPMPYGRLYRSGWGPSLPASVAWFLFESPTLWLTVFLFPFGQHAANPRSWILMSPYLIHYVHRTCIYTLRLHNTKSVQRFPISLFLFACTVTTLNSYLQTREISHYKDYDNDRWLWLRIVGGMFLFVWGMRLNIWADRTLTDLKGQDGEYRRPKGGWFEFVSCPNYFGELVEWFAWSIMTGSVVSLGFFLISFANLVPRAYVNHKWYLAKFKNYPKARKAVFPFLF